MYIISSCNNVYYMFLLYVYDIFLLHNTLYVYDCFQWHLGYFAKEYTPTHRGFLTHYGFLHGKADYWTHTHDTSMASNIL